jgi:cyclic pyranopterin phosphate synthase
VGAVHDNVQNVILRDSFGRAIRDLRVSLTDRCNFRCFYCLPHGEPPIAPKEQMLSYEEIEYVCEIFVSLGIEKLRLTGGEPMLRRDIETIIEKLSKLKSRGLIDLALTTNGYFLPERAQALKTAGLDRVTISARRNCCRKGSGPRTDQDQRGDRART